MPKAVFVVISECPKGREAEFNEWYDKVHIPDVLSIPGFVSATRYQLVGEPQEGQGRYLALYEIEASDPGAPVAALWQSIPELAAKGRLFPDAQMVYAAAYAPTSGPVTA